jgi:hypothetical protein
MWVEKLGLFGNCAQVCAAVIDNKMATVNPVRHFPIIVFIGSLHAANIPIHYDFAECDLIAHLSSSVKPVV